MHGYAAKWSTVGLFLLGLGTLIPTPAYACAAPNCMLGVRFPLPADGGVVPANVPGLVAVPPLLEKIDPSTVRLLLPDGTQVPTTVSEGAYQTQVLVPETPLEPGTMYRIEAKGDCELQATETESITFTAGPALPLPTTLGTLTVTAPEQGYVNVYGDSSCGGRVIRGNHATLRFTPSPELVPFLPWVHWSLEVDGEPWSHAKHGGVSATGEEHSETRRYENSRHLLFVYTFCDYVGCMDSTQRPPIHSLPPGPHRATLTATLEHANLTLPALSVDFELGCTEQGVTAGASLAAGCADGGPEPEIDAGPVPDGGPGTQPPDTADFKKGCTQAGGGLTALGMLATLSLLLGRRSRREER
ncbi:hypothetical protein [Comamonas sp. JC664]|uniref:hypothetical protein n=1 Tax=Comamonas sp. JC664 TaxID=2801917 RepID=UPI00174B8B8E|nr:hypothetical protein [Comamonas sp. JC664]MBL0694183.1 hypothetical protein [Comamonas sp. JC664]GHG76192.1 hypothetical protein GCM10012319_25130 [Comamonas sp. KCTC 72670]